MRALALGVVAGLSLLAGSAHAYRCTAVPSGAFTVNWDRVEIGVQVHPRCSEDISDPGRCTAAVRASMQAWNDVTCSDFLFRDDGDATDPRAGYDWRRPDDNRNIVVFREGNPEDPSDGWTHQRGALAITTVTFHSRTGRILDADIEVNGVPQGTAQFRFAVCNADGSDCVGRNDVQNTLTHEFGHVLGLDHPDNTEATMYASAPPAETDKRTLAQDDIDGICAIYPGGGLVVPCVAAPQTGLPEPRFKQIDQCDDTGTDRCGGPPGCTQAGPGTWGVAVVLATFGRRARRTLSRAG